MTYKDKLFVLPSMLVLENRKFKGYPRLDSEHSKEDSSEDHRDGENGYKASQASKHVKWEMIHTAVEFSELNTVLAV